MNESEIAYSLILRLQYEKLVLEGKLAEAEAKLEEAARLLSEADAEIEATRAKTAEGRAGDDPQGERPSPFGRAV